MSDDPVFRSEFDRVLNGVQRAEERMTTKIDDGFQKVNGRLGTVEMKASSFEVRLSIVERVIYAGVGLSLAAIAIAVLQRVIQQ